jgi:hypothetical protein
MLGKRNGREKRFKVLQPYKYRKSALMILSPIEKKKTKANLPPDTFLKQAVRCKETLFYALLIINIQKN